MRQPHNAVVHRHLVDPENLSASARMHIKWLCVRKSLSAVRGEDVPNLLLHVTASSWKLAFSESGLAFQNWDLVDCQDTHHDTCRHPQCVRCNCISQALKAVESNGMMKGTREVAEKLQRQTAFNHSDSFSPQSRLSV